MAKIYDNIETTFEQGLNDIVTNTGVKRVDFCVGYFNLRGWNMIIDQIDNLAGETIYEKDERKTRYCRLLIGMHRPPEDLIRELYGEKLPADADFVKKCKMRIAEDFRRQLQLGIPTKKDELNLQHLSRQMKDGKVCVKLYLREPLHAKLYLAYRPEDKFNPIQAIMGSSNLTYSGLTKQGELNAEFGDSDSAKKLSEWFCDRWEDNFCLDITEELIKVIDDSWAGEEDIPPYYIYLKTAYHLSQDARTGIKEFILPPEFRKDLFDFQQTAAKIAAKHINNDKRGGAMIGDVVGLGKTITACAIIKLFEQAYGNSTLIICPANLQDMWQRKYVEKYDLKATVWSMSKDIDVDAMRYFRLIVIDESHNLRNPEGKRYRNIKSLIEHQGSKVLLLTATPYNKDFGDLSAQLRLFIHDDQDLGIRPENYIRTLGGDRAFLQKHNETFIRSIKAFEKSNKVEDWNELMKLFLVRRTRTFVKENYARTDKTNGRKYLQFNDGSKSYFPDRLPHSIKFPIKENDQYSRLYSEEMITLMESLKLPRYGLSQYISQEKETSAQNHEKRILENLSRAGARMMGFCKSTFFKRMDSCGYSFLLTLYRHLLRNMLFVYAIEEKIAFPIGDENTLPEDFTEDDDTNNSIFSDGKERSTEELFAIPTDLEKYKEKAAEYYGILLNKNNIAWVNSQYFKKTLKQDLLKDCEVIIKMIQLCKDWNPDEDQKLNEIQKLVSQQHGEDKVLVFTQFSDTALYLYKMLKKRGIINIDIATGNSDNPTIVAEKFSPVSNDVKNIPPFSEQTRVLIATDVLSEGQNLQDAHVIVNYDLPWAIIRLIQRAGRVDRIGQKSKTIDCYSFFPTDGVEQVIKLRSRLNARINENANVVGNDEIFFEGNEQNLRDLYNEKSGILDDDDDNDVDLSSQAYQIWKEAVEKDPKLKEIIPQLNDIVYSTKQYEDEQGQGVITYAKTYNDFDVLTWIDKNGNIITQSQKRILQALKCESDTPAITPLENHHELVGKAIQTIETENTIGVGGMLGNRFSTRYRIIQLLEDYVRRDTDIFFSEERKNLLVLAIDQIYNNQLTESSKFLLGRLLRTSNSDEIIETIIDLFKEEKLCLVDQSKNEHKDPVIICSMGLNKVN